MTSPARTTTPWTTSVTEVRKQAADNRVGANEHSRQHDCGFETHAGVGIHDLPESADLRRRPDNGTREKHDHDEALDARGISLPEEIGKRGEPSRPKRIGKQEADNDDSCRVREWIDERTAQPMLIDRASGRHDGLGTEVRGKNGEGDQPAAEPAAGEDVVVWRS